MPNSLRPAVPAGSPMRRRIMNALTALVILGFAAWCVVSFGRDASAMRFESLVAHWPSVLAVAGLSLFNYVLRTWRWRTYLAHYGHPLPWGYCWLTYTAGFAFTLSPGKIGEMIRARYYQERAIPLSQITAAFFLERLIDLLVIIALCFFALASLGDNQHLVYGVGLFLLAMMVGLAVAPWDRWHQRAVAAAPRAGHGAVVKITRLMAEARGLLSLRLLGFALVLALAAWFAEAIGLKLIVDFVSEASIPWPSVVGIYAIAVAVGALSFLPGGLGPTEAIMVTLLSAAGLSLGEATLATLVCRLLTLWFAVLLGWTSVLLLRPATRNLQERKA